jgi:hypothetical protein
MSRLLTSAVGSDHTTGHPAVPARRRVGLLAALLAVTLVGLADIGRPAAAQTVPLAEMVPLQELETVTDDLIRLATSYADALREYKTAKLTLDTLQNLRPNAVITGLEVRIAQVNAETAQAKLSVLRAIVDKQLSAAQTKLEIVKRIEAMDNQSNTGAPESKLRVTQAEATVAILKMIQAMK